MYQQITRLVIYRLYRYENCTVTGDNADYLVFSREKYFKIYNVRLYIYREIPKENIGHIYGKTEREHRREENDLLGWQTCGRIFLNSDFH